MRLWQFLAVIVFVKVSAFLVLATFTQSPFGAAACVGLALLLLIGLWDTLGGPTDDDTFG